MSVRLIEMYIRNSSICVPKLMEMHTPNAWRCTPIPTAALEEEA